MTSQVSAADRDAIRAAVRALPPMSDEALTRVAVLFASLDEQQRRHARRERAA